MTDERYIVTDIEADGPVPGLYSMLSLASVVVDPDGRVVDQFSANLAECPGAGRHPANMKWWATQPAAWEACRTNIRDPAEVMLEYVTWVKRVAAQPVFVAYPVAFDYPFVSYYAFRFTGDNPLFPIALDIGSFAMAVLNLPFEKTCFQHRLPAEWLENLPPHTHLALDDARGHAEVFVRLLKKSRLPAGLPGGSAP
jgi:DNA polymerase III alpha subunit (gram-positive type)